MNNILPDQAQIIVIGGGIIGCSVAYHLAKEGAKDVLLLERGQLTCGSTFHAAGLVGQLRSSANITRVLKNSVELYRSIEAETGQATGWKMNGGLRLACTQERWIELKRQATTAQFWFGNGIAQSTGGAGIVALDGSRRRDRRGFFTNRRAGQSF